MAIKSENELLDAQSKLFRADPEFEDGSIVASFFLKTEVEHLVSRLTTKYVKIFLILDESNNFSFAMAGADDAPVLEPDDSQVPTNAIFADLMGIGNLEGLEAHINCPPHCQKDIEKRLGAARIVITHKTRYDPSGAND